jgi:ATP-dependent Clp protease ATP-binding subunit ClpA
LIGSLTTWEYQDLLGGDAEFADLVTRIEIDEPIDEEALAILESKLEELEREHQVRIDEDVPRRTVAVASAYVLSERHPAKALKLLRRACENVSFNRTQRAAEETRVSSEDVVEVAADLTGVPFETLSGDGGTADYEAALTASVVGQPDAVATVATELKLIKSGLTEPDRPASVLLFAGMTGVGKTELAKALARIYSATGRLQTYSMGNFTEPHTVSGIIGVPPGYVGHDQGGRLVNELNADPYAVFLLDEAEKAHPNVWKPFLNLFDEGWIVDQRGIKAHADRAIFILTTNAGDQQIAQMSQQGKSEEEIISRVKQTLSRIRHERSTQPVFAPQFLARLGRILIFRPLDEAAMIGIARIQVERTQTTWKRKREKELIVPEALIQHIGKHGHQRNQDAKGQEGGRIIRKLLVDTVESPIQQAATDRPGEYKACTRIEVAINTHGPMDVSSEYMEAEVRFI